MLYLLIIMSCKSIILKKDSLKVPFSVKEGTYKIELYNLDYPKDLENKLKFLNELNFFMIKFISDKTLEKMKCNFIINERFIKDLISIEKNSLIEDEKFIVKSASELDKSEIETLNKFLKNKNEKKKTQEILNLQIKALFKLLNQDAKFETKRTYTELDKDRLLDNIRIFRSRLLKLIKHHKVEIITKIKNPYESLSLNKRNSNYFSREVILPRNNIFSDRFLEYKKYGVILLDNIKKKDSENIMECELDIDLDYYILTNDSRGYKQLKNNKVLLFIGEGEYTGTYPKYLVELLNIKMETKELNNLNLKNEYNIKDLFNRSY